MIQENSSKVKKMVANTNAATAIAQGHIGVSPQKSMGNLKGMKPPVSATISENDSEVSNLSCEDFISMLMRKGFTPNDCQPLRGVSYFHCKKSE